MEDNTILLPSLGVHVASKSSMSCERPHNTKAKVRHNNEVDSTITSVEESVNRFGLHNDMIFVNNVIKIKKLFLYALLHWFHEQEVSLDERLVLDVFRIYLYVKESDHVYRNSS